MEEFTATKRTRQTPWAAIFAVFKTALFLPPCLPTATNELCLP
jgi:hypothetical protein